MKKVEASVFSWILVQMAYLRTAHPLVSKSLKNGLKVLFSSQFADRGCTQVLHKSSVEQNDLFTETEIGIKQEAPLPQRNSASAAHIYLGWL